MDFAFELPGDDHAEALDVLAGVTQWHRPSGRMYDTAEADLSHPLLAGSSRAFFIKMVPGSNVYRHRDPPGVVDYFYTDHIVCSTNDYALICWEYEGVERSQHLGLGKRYRIVDRGVLHWAVNDGDTDRVHLLIEYPKPPPG